VLLLYARPTHQNIALNSRLSKGAPGLRSDGELSGYALDKSVWASLTGSEASVCSIIYQKLKETIGRFCEINTIWLAARETAAKALGRAVIRCGAAAQLAMDYR